MQQVKFENSILFLPLQHSFLFVEFAVIQFKEKRSLRLNHMLSINETLHNFFSMNKHAKDSFTK